MKELRMATLWALVICGGLYIFMKIHHSNQSEIYAVVPKIDGGVIPAPYSIPDKKEATAEKMAHFRDDIPAIPETVVIGSTTIISDWEWVKTVNEQSIVQNFSNGKGKLYEGDTCGVEFSGIITVVEKEGSSFLLNTLLLEIQ